MQILSVQALSEYPPLLQTEFAVPSDSQFPWKIILRSSDTGLKKMWIIGQDSCPITKLEFELNEYLCGAGTIELSYLNFPFHANDILDAYFENDRKYRAYIQNTIDPKGGKIKLKPYKDKFNIIFYNGNLTAADHTIEEIFEHVIEATDDDTTIVWNSDFIDTGDTSVYRPDYRLFEFPKKIFDDYIKKCDDRRWGVRPDNIFTVYHPSTTVDHVFFQDDNPVCTKIKNNKNYDKIKKTRSQVFRKTAAPADEQDSMTRAGEVGYGAGYAVIELETIVGKKEGKFIASEVLQNNTEALVMAYAELTALSLPESIVCEDVDLTQYFPVIGERLTIQDIEDLILRIIIDCDSITDWNGATAETTDYKEGSGSIKFTGTGSPTEMIYDFGRIEHWYNPEKLGFMIKATRAGEYLECSTGEVKRSAGLSIAGIGTAGRGDTSLTGLGDTLYKIQIHNNNLWQWFDVDFISNFRYFGINFHDTVASTTVIIDQISLYLYDRSVYTANVRKAKFTIESKGTKCNMTLNNYDDQLNDEYFDWIRKVEKLEAIAQKQVT